MKALILSEVNLNLFVVRGVLRKNAIKINTGFKRKYSDAYMDRSRPNISLISKGISLYLRHKGQKPTFKKIASVIQNNGNNLQELANFSRKSGLLYRFLTDTIIFAYALEHGIEKTCSKLRKASNDKQFSKLRGLPKLIALEKL